MALYSVWNWDRNAWAVYSTPHPVSVGDDPKAPRPAKTSPIGADPDTQVNALPMGAKLVGYDHVARGEVRRLSALPSLGDDTSSSGGGYMKYAIGFALGACVVWYLKE